TEAGARALADSPSLANLRLLDLGGVAMTVAGLDAMLNGPHWRLAGLGLVYCDLPADAVRVLAESPRLARLTWLDLSQNPRLRGGALMPLAESPYLCPLTELGVRGLGLDPEVRTALR